jgi:hypothetical protein
MEILVLDHLRYFCDRAGEKGSHSFTCKSTQGLGFVAWILKMSQNCTVEGVLRSSLPYVKNRVVKNIVRNFDDPFDINVRKNPERRNIMTNHASNKHFKRMKEGSPGQYRTNASFSCKPGCSSVDW